MRKSLVASVLSLSWILLAVPVTVQAQTTSTIVFARRQCVGVTPPQGCEDSTDCPSGEACNFAIMRMRDDGLPDPPLQVTFPSALEEDANPTVCPAGQVIYFDRTSGGETHGSLQITGYLNIFKTDLTTNPYVETNVSDGYEGEYGEDRYPSWSPGGNKIVYAHLKWGGGGYVDVWKQSPLYDENVDPDILTNTDVEERGTTWAEVD